MGTELSNDPIDEWDELSTEMMAPTAAPNPSRHPMQPTAQTNTGNRVSVSRSTTPSKNNTPQQAQQQQRHSKRKQPDKLSPPKFYTADDDDSKSIPTSSLNILATPPDSTVAATKKSKTHSPQVTEQHSEALTIDQNVHRYITDKIYGYITTKVKKKSVTLLKEQISLGVRQFLIQNQNGHLQYQNQDDYLEALCTTINRTYKHPIFREHITPQSLFGTIDISSHNE